MVDVGLAVFLALWLVATVLNAGRPGAEVIRRAGGFGYLIPVWNFFAPQPAMHDYHVLYRDRLVDGSVTVWREAPRFFERRPRTAPLWNPDKVFKKAIFDLAMALDREAEGIRRGGEGAPLAQISAEDRAAVHLCAPYLHLLTYVSGSLPHARDAESTQFAVVKLNQLRDELTPVLLSDHHRLEQAARPGAALQGTGEVAR